MKGFFTCLPKGSVLPLLLSCLISGVFSASAEEYRSMIRYDRVWECISDGHDDPDLVVKCMKFVGTEEINGKEYYKIETFRKTFPKYDPVAKTYGYDSYVDGLNQHEGYLREESGMAYTLIVCQRDHLPDCLGEDYNNRYGPLYIPGKNEPGDNEVIVEIPIYDFTYKKGQSYAVMSFCMGYSASCVFTVDHDENIDIGGEEYRKIYLLHEGMEKNEHWYGEEIVEGVGAVEYGCLNYHEFHDRPTMRWAQNYFNRLLDLDGNVLYDPRNTLYDIEYDSFNTPDGVEGSEEIAIEAPVYGAGTAHQQSGSGTALHTGW
ncbi:MAG: hypothetical protein K2H22_04290 [Muribaculaceae bacterium]|nr:hypothetical protein [Muribaculaceae bacterium]